MEPGIADVAYIQDVRGAKNDVPPSDSNQFGWIGTEEYPVLKGELGTVKLDDNSEVQSLEVRVPSPGQSRAGGLGEIDNQTRYRVLIPKLYVESTGSSFTFVVYKTKSSAGKIIPGPGWIELTAYPETAGDNRGKRSTLVPLH